MRYVRQNIASEDTVQFFDALGAPVLGVLYDEILVYIRKDGEVGYSAKTITAADWTERGGGNYAIDFVGSDFDTLGLFRYQILSPTSAFLPYQDGLNVVDEIPIFPINPPYINLQTEVPIGVSPDPVYRGSNLTISGTDLANATVTIGGVPVDVISNTNGEIVVVVRKAVNPGDLEVSLGDDQIVEVTTPGGKAYSTVDVVLDPADIPGLGMVNLYGYIHSVILDGSPKQGIGIFGRVLDMPNIGDGVGWTDDVKQVDTDINGYFSIFMPRNTRVEIHIPKIRYRREFITPDVDMANLFTEIP